MTKTIWKFTAPIVDVFEVKMPRGAKILAAQSQRENIVIWAMIDPSAEHERRRFTVYGTGGLLPDDPGVYIGTAQQADGALVWHLFEVVI